MNASLPELQPALSGSGNTAADGLNLSGIQQDSEFPNDFAPILEQVAVQADERLPVEVENLYRELQALPEDGNLLPLLQQVLETTAAAGGEPAETLQQIAAGVQELKSTQSMNLAEALTIVLPPYLNNTPVVSASPDPAPATVPGSDLLPSVLSLRDRQGAAADRVPGMPAVVTTTVDVPQDTRQMNPDRTTGLLLRPAADPDQPEQAVLAAAIRQFTRLQQTAGADTPARPEPVSATLAQQAQTAAVPQGPAATPVVNVAHSLNQPGWDEAFGEKIQWMMGQRLQGAQMRLNPAQLGPMEVSIQVRNDQASIQFSSAHAVVRDALEAAIPRLRDMMESSGVELVDVDVSGQSFAERRATPGQQPVARDLFSGGAAPEADSMIETSVASILSAGRLDLFA